MDVSGVRSVVWREEVEGAAAIFGRGVITQIVAPLRSAEVQNGGRIAYSAAAISREDPVQVTVLTITPYGNERNQKLQTGHSLWLH